MTRAYAFTVLASLAMAVWIVSPARTGNSVGYKSTPTENRPPTSQPSFAQSEVAMWAIADAADRQKEQADRAARAATIEAATWRAKYYQLAATTRAAQ